MAHGRKKAPFRKRFLAKYVLWLEAAGFLFIGILIIGMVGSAIYKIDDVMKFSGVIAEIRRDSVVVPIESYVNSVSVEEGSAVEQGQELMRVTGSAQNSALLKAMDATRKALEALQADSAKAEIERPLREALARSLSSLEKEPSRPVAAPIAGIVKSGEKYQLQDLSGKVVSGVAASVTTYDSIKKAFTGNFDVIKDGLMMDQCSNVKNLTDIQKQILQFFKYIVLKRNVSTIS